MLGTLMEPDTNICKVLFGKNIIYYSNSIYALICQSNKPLYSTSYKYLTSPIILFRKVQGDFKHNERLHIEENMKKIYCVRFMSGTNTSAPFRFF